MENKTSKINRVKELTEVLSKASYVYYGLDNSIMTDKEYDLLYDELEKLEKETGFVLAGSPTQKVQGFLLDGFKKVTHSKPMLSAAKTKNPEEIKKFIGKNKYYCSYKLDGLTLVLKYNNNGEFEQGITRGNGLIGEDVTEACRFIQNIPMKIPVEHSLEVRGECVISWEEFNRINSSLENPYSHPRNLSAGTLRQLDLNVLKERKLSFVLFEIVSPTFTWKTKGLNTMEDFGFEVVSRAIPKNNETGIEDCIKAMQPEFCEYPVDGLVFEIDNNELSKKLGATSHHESCRMALKWKDSTYETTLRNILWQTSKTGRINPIALFDEVDLDGALTTRATLNNLSFIEDLELGIGDTLTVYRANMVIPTIDDNLTRSNTWTYPKTCPCCGSPTEVRNDNGSKMLYCTGMNCKAQLLGKLTHAVSRNALNIDNLSEATLEIFINKGWLNSIKDIYHLDEYKREMTSLTGFGVKSVNKLLEAIEKSRHTTLDRFLYSLSVPLLGRSASKDINKFCEANADVFVELMATPTVFSKIDGIGDALIGNLETWWDENRNSFMELIEEFEFETEEESETKTSAAIQGKSFCITGKLEHYNNRDMFIHDVESHGGKVVSGVTSKTDYLVTNDKTSGSSKNKKAQELNIPIISELEFLNMIEG